MIISRFVSHFVCELTVILMLAWLGRDVQALLRHLFFWIIESTT